MIGVSRDPADFSRLLMNEFIAHGFDVVPVNPLSAEVDGRVCFQRVADIAPPVEGALVMTPASQSAQVVRDCAEAGVGNVWLYRGAGKGAFSEEALKAGEAAGIEMVAGECPFMFLPGSRFPHNVHAWIRKLTFTYPG